MPLPRILYYKFLLDRNLKKNRRQILQLRERKFRRLLHYAFTNSKFYREYYSGYGIKAEDLSSIPIAELPIIDKETMMENFDDLLTVSDINRSRVETFLENSPAPETVMDDRYHVIHTSGSSGVIGYFIYGPREWDFIKAISLRIFPGFGLEKKRYAFVGAADGHYAGISLFLSPLNSLEEWFYEDYMVMDIGHPLSKYTDQLTELNPHNLTGYPSAVKMLAEMQRDGIIDITPDTVVCGGEPLMPVDREYIKETWGVSPVNNYAASESLMIGVGRKGREGLYLFDDANYIEIEEDKYYLTNLYNYTQPLIRYEMDDLLVPADNRNPDWPFTRIKEVAGRQEETLWFKSSAGEWEFIHPIVIVELYIRGLKKYQVVQRDSESFVFRAVIEESRKEKKVTGDIKAKLDDILQKKNLNNISYKIRVVSRIESESSSGKFRLIITEGRNER
ncbi:MAG: phenylacetate--CoA ligase family protein [Halanaerobiales bacterium]